MRHVPLHSRAFQTSSLNQQQVLPTVTALLLKTSNLPYVYMAAGTCHILNLNGVFRIYVCFFFYRNI